MHRWELACRLHMDQHGNRVKDVVLELLEQSKRRAVNRDQLDNITVPSIAPSEINATLDHVANAKASVRVASNAGMTAVAEGRLRVAGLGHHTVTDDFMFPVLVFGFVIFTVV